MIPKVKDTLLRMAYENPGTKGKFKLAAGVVWKGRLVASGVNSYKTHPIMTNGAYRDQQMCLHAEAAALVKASKIMLPYALSQSELYVVRVCKGQGIGPEWLTQLGYREALAKPCKGCMALIEEYGVPEVKWTEG